MKKVSRFAGVLLMCEYLVCESLIAKCLKYIAYRSLYNYIQHGGVPILLNRGKYKKKIANYKPQY
jgi:hypothetical protein